MARYSTGTLCRPAAAAAALHYDSIVIIHQRHWPPTPPRYDVTTRNNVRQKHRHQAAVYDH